MHAAGPRHLLLTVHLHADALGTARYHGMSQGTTEWPPAPARVYQALVAGVARGNALPQDVVPALQHLERLPPPVIAAPLRRIGQPVSVYVPNNDADALNDPSDPAEIGSIRTAKVVQPSLFDARQALLYAWPLDADGTDTPGTANPAGWVAQAIRAAHELYQLGRGVDMAWADARVVADDELQQLLSRYRGAVHRPVPASAGSAAPMLACPAAGSLASLVQRHGAIRLRGDGAGRKARVLFTNAPKPRFASVGYAPVRRLTLYDLRERSSSRAWPWPLSRASALVEQVRDAAAAKLRQALPEMADNIERCVIGRDADGAGRVPLAQRLHIVPLPSIGSAHTDPSIRRLLIEVPSGCPLAAEDIDWAFSGLDRVEADTGEVSPWQLVRADHTGMQHHYCDPAQHWQSVTAVALPGTAARRRIDPLRQRADAKPAAERADEEARAQAAVVQALRQAGVLATAAQVRVQREPFTGQGQRAESFAEGTRFAKERLWHVALSFDRPVAGPLAIGDGRFVGLGVMAPSAAASGYAAGDPAAWTGADADGVVALQRLGGEAAAPAEATALAMARALRRAVMARVREVVDPTGRLTVNRYFSGHVPGSPAPDKHPDRHLAYHWDALRQRWLVLAPHRLEHRPAHDWERNHLAHLAQALAGITELRAGVAGFHAVQPAELAPEDPVLRSARCWQSITPYAVTRHRRLASVQAALEADVLAECGRLQLPMPAVQVLAVQSVPGQGVQGLLRLRFAVALPGPLALGRTSLLGGGLFAAVDDTEATGAGT